MLLKDIRTGVEYATVEWVRLDQCEEVLRFGRPGSEPPVGRDWARGWRESLRELTTYAQRGIVLEKGVQVGHYARKGVLVQLLDRQTGEPGEVKPRRAVQIVMEWDRLHAIYHDVLDAYEAEEEKRREDQEKAKRERQEASAREWMRRTFEEAKGDLEDMVALGALASFDDGQVRALVERRYPEGNPYLTGAETVY